MTSDYRNYTIKGSKGDTRKRHSQAERLLHEEAAMAREVQRRLRADFYTRALTGRYGDVSRLGWFFDFAPDGTVVPR